jgi:methylglutaconyl-CoA hydratase
VSAPVRIERGGPGGLVARVTLARPSTRNALGAEAIETLHAAFRDLAGEAPDRLRAVVLAGDGPAFCAGADLAWMRAAMALSREENEADANRLAAMLATVDACPVPVIARVQGAALGGGAGLCAVADVVVAEAKTRLGFPEVRLGLVPATIAPYVVRRIGEGAARALFVTGERIDAHEARRIGLVHRVAEGEDALDSAVDEVLAAILAGGPEAVRAAKALVRDVARRPAGDTGLTAATARLLAERRASAEAREGLAAVDERRPAAWTPPGDADA